MPKALEMKMGLFSIIFLLQLKISENKHGSINFC